MDDDKRAVNTAGILIPYLIIIVIAEILISYPKELGLSSPYLGIGIYVILILALLMYSFLYPKKYSLLASALTFLPLIRILSTSLVGFQFIHTVVIINFLILITAYMFIKNNNLTARSLGFYRGSIGVQLGIALTGILFGYIEYSILGASVGINEKFPMLIAYALALFIFTGFSEELVFRGIILTAAENVMGRNYSLIFVSVIFASMHIIWRSPLDLLFVFLVALFYGYAFQRTRSLLGITLSHGLTNVIMFLVIPAWI